MYSEKYRREHQNIIKIPGPDLDDIISSKASPGTRWSILADHIQMRRCMQPCPELCISSQQVTNADPIAPASLPSIQVRLDLPP